MELAIKETGINTKKAKFSVSKRELWSLKSPEILLDIKQYKKIKR